jgi:hypothetical protein
LCADTTEYVLDLAATQLPPMLDRFRTRLARFIIRHLTRPRELVIRAWLWLAAESRDLQDKRHCLSTVVRLDPDWYSRPHSSPPIRDIPELLFQPPAS